MPIKKPYDSQHLIPNESTKPSSSVIQSQSNRASTRLVARSGLSYQPATQPTKQRSEIKNSIARAHMIRKGLLAPPSPQQITNPIARAHMLRRSPGGMQIEYVRPADTQATQQANQPGQPNQGATNTPQLVKLAPGTVFQIDFDTGRVTVA